MMVSGPGPANAKTMARVRAGMTIQKVAVLGAGNMGSGIAQAFAQAGLAVAMRDVKPELVQKGRERIEAPLRKRVESGKMAAAEVDALLARIHGTTDIHAAPKHAAPVVAP